MRNSNIIILACFALTLTCGCVYRANISQGNLIEQEHVDQIEVGMTKTQIRFLLGTPMIKDPFTNNRWDYVYYLAVGRKGVTRKRWISVYFDDELVSEVHKDQELDPAL